MGFNRPGQVLRTYGFERGFRSGIMHFTFSYAQLEHGCPRIGSHLTFLHLHNLHAALALLKAGLVKGSFVFDFDPSSSCAGRCDERLSRDMCHCTIKQIGK
jgi:hypothetical protein